MDERQPGSRAFDLEAWPALTRGARMIALDHPLQKGIPIYPSRWSDS